MACKLSNVNVSDHFAVHGKTIQMPKGDIKEVSDYKLSRYACYLIVQNGNPSKREIALGQTYFAIQTRKMEITEEEYSKLSEDERRLYARINVTNKNNMLTYRAKKSEVKNFGKFNNYGYMGGEELGANLFRITQKDAKLKKDKIDSERIYFKINYYNIYNIVLDGFII